MIQWLELQQLKKICPKKKKTRKKKYLTDTLTNLYKKYKDNSNVKMSYQTFCKYRPFWILHPKESNRNTCACKVYVNIDLLVKYLHAGKILKETNLTGILESLCCEHCLSRTCGKCKSRNWLYTKFRNDDEIKYYQ